MSVGHRQQKACGQSLGGLSKGVGLHEEMARWVAILAIFTVLVARRALSAEFQVGRGQWTLRTAIQNASSGDTVRVVRGTYAGPEYCGLSLRSSISIVADDGAVIDCEGTSRILNIIATPNVTIEGLTFRNGMSSSEFRALALSHVRSIRYSTPAPVISPAPDNFKPENFSFVAVDFRCCYLHSCANACFSPLNLHKKQW
jgi:hypothetical protein